VLSEEIERGAQTARAAPRTPAQGLGADRALVGYTQRRQTTLFNMLTGSDALASDALFVTLDRSSPTAAGRTAASARVRHGRLSSIDCTRTRAAFRATLENRDEDLILHVMTHRRRTPTADVGGSARCSKRSARSMCPSSRSTQM